MKVTSTVEGRERFPVRVRYPRELRDDPESLSKILIPTPVGAQIPLSQVVDFEYVRGPQAIKSENTFLVGYVLFDKRDGFAEVDVVNYAQEAIQKRIDAGELTVPSGISYKFSGSYENQIRAVKRLSIVIPISLIVIFLLLFFQFKTVIASSIHFSGVFVAFAGGFIMLWLYSQDWFMNFAISGVNMRDLFQMHKKRVRPAMMTAAVAIIALLPVLTSTGKGADVMIPMAIPTFGGMTIQIMTMFVVPVLQAYWRETVIKNQNKKLKKIQ